MPSSLINTTPFPNVLLDEVLPRLSGAQWCVLCVIVRQTCGWQDENRKRKARDWMTHGQLKRRTGLASASISHAIDMLVRQGLIEVQDESGRQLASSVERRRARCALFFSLSRHCLKPEPALPTPLGNEEAALGNEEIAATPGAVSQKEERFSKSGFQKVKTTKETQTKEDVVFKNQKHLPASSHAAQQDALALDLSSEALHFIACYQRKYREHIAEGGPRVEWTQDAATVQNVLEKYSLSHLDNLLDAFFSTSSLINSI